MQILFYHLSLALKTLGLVHFSVIILSQYRLVVYVCYVLNCNRDNQSMTYQNADERIRCVRSGRSKKLVEIKRLVIVCSRCILMAVMSEEQEKVTGWTIDMH